MAQDGNARRFLPCYGAQRLASPRTQLNTFPLSIRIPAEEKKKGYINISGDVYSYSCRGKKKGNIDISGDNQEVLLVGASACVKEKPKIGFAVHRIQDHPFVFLSKFAKYFTHSSPHSSMQSSKWAMSFLS